MNAQKQNVRFEDASPASSPKNQTKNKTDAQEKLNGAKNVLKVVSARKKLAAISQIEETFHSEFGKNTLEFDHILEECQHLKFGDQMWQDPIFQANVRSLSLTFNKLPQSVQRQWSTITWKRPGEFLQKDKIVLFDTIEPNDIKQGLLGDCYFLCALSALAEQDQLIQRLFHTKEKSKFGVYSVWLNINGEWVNLNIDDQIPFIEKGSNKQPAFSRGQGDEIWVLLLEKAYAKVYGSYEIIEGGNPSYALRDLTGAPCENKDNLTAAEFWKYLEENDNSKNVLTCYTRQTNIREEENKLGILSGHAYSILEHATVRGNDNAIHRILKIRNPWGKKEWTGDWGDESECWNPMLRQKLNVEKRDDGCFWMSIEDFAKYFEGIGNCKVRSNYVYNSIKLDFSSKNIQVLHFTVSEYTHTYISLNQMDERMFMNATSDYTYSFCRMFVLKKDANKESFIFSGAKYHVDRNMFIELQLHPGEYVVLTQFFWEQSIIREANLSSYSDKPISFGYLDKVDGIEMLKTCFRCVAIESVSRKEQKHTKYQGIYDGIEYNFPLMSKRYGVQYGSFYVYYSNGEAQQVFQEDSKYTMSGYIPVEPYHQKMMADTNQYKREYTLNISITIPGDREAVVLFDCDGNQYSYHIDPPKPRFFSSQSAAGKSIVADEKYLLKRLRGQEEKRKLQVKKNISSFGRSQHIGQILKPKLTEFGYQQKGSNQALVSGAASLQSSLAQISNEATKDDQTTAAMSIETKEIPEIEQEFLDFFDENIFSCVTAWGRLTIWLTFLMFPICFLQAFAKNFYLDVIIAMSMVNLINAETMTEFFLRKIILGLYVSVVVDVIFVMNSSDKHHILTGQSLTVGAYYVSFAFIFVGILFKIFAAFAYLHVWKNFLSSMPYVYQSYRKIKYFLRDLQLDEETIARFTQNPQSNSVSPITSHVTLEVAH